MSISATVYLSYTICLMVSETNSMTQIKIELYDAAMKEGLVKSNQKRD